MNILDNHVHTHFSSDGKDTMEDVIKRSINIGVRHLTFTDHMEFKEDYFSIDFEAYISKIQEYKEKYKKEIELLTGIEVGYQKQAKNEISRILNSYPFDFVLCSTHTIDEVNVSDPNFFKGYSKKEAYTKYFQSIIATTKNFKDYDTYGHLDYIVRYGVYNDNSLIYDDFTDVIDELLLSIISSGKGIELNTSGYRYGLDAIHPNINIVKRYKELGGEIITVGSDSHRSLDVCKDFDKAYNMLSNLGFRYVCLYKERVPNFIPIEKIKVISIA